MIKLLVVGDLALRGVALSRLFSLERLTQNGYPVTAIVRNKYPNTYDIEWCDVVFFMRAITHADLKFLKTCKVLGKKIWVDSDDDILNVPIDHSGYFDFQDNGLRESYIEIHKIADAISYSTQTLMASHLQYNKIAHLIPCAYPDERIERLLESKPTNKVVLWRGTATHEKSLLEFTPAILQVARANPDWEFCFSGFKPWTILEKMKNRWEVKPFMEVDDFLEFIHHRRPAVNMVVRTDNQFTRSRSCISYVEATFGGSVTVAPAWEEWKRPGVINYKNKGEFVKKMNYTMKRKNKTTQSAKYIKENHTWSQVNKLQYKLLEGICSTH